MARMIWKEFIKKNSRGLIEVTFPHFPGKITKELEERFVADF
jgi:Fe-S cluster biosynthesis and repair protein YggX